MFSVLTKLVFSNNLIKSRIYFNIIYLPLFLFIFIIIMKNFGFDLLDSYAVISISGMSFHFMVTIFSLSAFSPSMKFILINNLLIKIIIYIYFLGVICSFSFSILSIGLILIGQYQISILHILISFLLVNFVFAPLGLWISSFDFVKINLFETNNRFHQPSATYMVVSIFFIIIFFLFFDASSEFHWDLTSILFYLFGLIGIIGVSLKYILSSVIRNYKNSILK